MFLAEDVANTGTGNYLHRSSTHPRPKRNLYSRAIQHTIKTSKAYTTRLPKFSPPQMSIAVSYLPVSMNRCLSMENRPPAIIGVLQQSHILKRNNRTKQLMYSIGPMAFFLFAFRSGESPSHLKCKLQSKPPTRSAEAPMYWKLSMLSTSMMGLTT